MTGIVCAIVGNAVVSAVAEVIRLKKGITAVGNAQVDTAQSKFGGASALFDGTGDYLQSPANSDFDLGTANKIWTIEGWLYVSSLPNAYKGIISCQDGSTTSGGGTAGWGVYIDNNNRLTFIGNANSATYNSTSGAFTANSWQHWAVVRNNSSLKMFVNGVETYTTSGYVDRADNDRELLIGRAYNISSGYNGVLDFPGWLDEIRISKSARYTTGFTPSTTPFTNDANTVLLIHADGTDASTYFEDDNGQRTQKGITAIGNAQVDTAQSKFGGASALFDGTGDYLIVGNTVDADMALTSTTWTVEYWARINSHAGQYQGTIGIWDPVSPTGSVWYVTTNAYNSTSKMGISYVYGTNSLSGDLSFGSALSTGVWQHHAFVRNGNTLTAYLDGVSQGTHDMTGRTIDITGYNSSSNTTLKMTIGALTAGSGAFNGHLDEIRISNVARYTAGFTPSTTPFVNDANTVLLIHADGTDAITVFRDDNGVRSPKSIVALGNAQIDTAQSKFGGTSALFDGTGDYLDTNFSSDIAATTGSATVECFIRITSTASVLGICNQSASGDTNGFTVLIISGKIYAYWRGSATYTMVSTTTLSTNTWHHIAIVNDNGTGRLFINGTQEDSDAGWGDGYTTTTNFIVGRGRGNGGGLFDSTNYDFNGWIDEFRVSNNARYTANFTPTTTPFQNDANTVLLLHMDGTDASTVFVDDAGVTPTHQYS